MASSLITLSLTNHLKEKSNILYYDPSGKSYTNQIKLEINNGTGEALPIKQNGSFELDFSYLTGIDLSKVTLDSMDELPPERVGWKGSANDGILTLQNTGDTFEWNAGMTLSFTLTVPIANDKDPVTGKFSIKNYTDIPALSTYLSELGEKFADICNTLVISYEVPPNITPAKKALNVGAQFVNIGGMSNDNNVVFVTDSNTPISSAIKNTLAFEINNQSGEDIQGGNVVITIISGDEQWAMAPADQMKTYQLSVPSDYTYGNDWSVPGPPTENTQTELFSWTCHSNTSTLLAGSGNTKIRLQLSDIITYLKSGTVTMMIQFRGMKNFQDATLFRQIQKEEAQPGIISFRCLNLNTSVNMNEAVSLSWQTFDLDRLDLHVVLDGEQINNKDKVSLNQPDNTPFLYHPSRPFIPGKTYKFILYPFKTDQPNPLPYRKVLVDIKIPLPEIKSFSGQINYQTQEIEFSWEVLYCEQSQVTLNGDSSTSAKGKNIHIFPLVSTYVLKASNETGVTSKLLSFETTAVSISGSANLTNPRGLFFGTSGDIYISNQNSINHVVESGSSYHCADQIDIKAGNQAVAMGMYIPWNSNSLILIKMNDQLMVYDISVNVLYESLEDLKHKNDTIPKKNPPHANLIYDYDRTHEKVVSIVSNGDNNYNVLWVNNAEKTQKGKIIDFDNGVEEYRDPFEIPTNSEAIAMATDYRAENVYIITQEQGGGLVNKILVLNQDLYLQNTLNSSPNQGYPGFDQPIAVAVDTAKNHLYVMNKGWNAITALDIQNDYQLAGVYGPFEFAEQDQVPGNKLLVDSKGNLFFLNKAGCLKGIKHESHLQPSFIGQYVKVFDNSLGIIKDKVSLQEVGLGPNWNPGQILEWGTAVWIWGQLKTNNEYWAVPTWQLIDENGTHSVGVLKFPRSQFSKGSVFIKEEDLQNLMYKVGYGRQDLSDPIKLAFSVNIWGFYQYNGQYWAAPTWQINPDTKEIGIFLIPRTGVADGTPTNKDLLDLYNQTHSGQAPIHSLDKVNQLGEAVYLWSQAQPDKPATIPAFQQSMVHSSYKNG
jgi:hypothetical protein